jgi:hypothetical protein
MGIYAEKAGMGIAPFVCGDISLKTLLFFVSIRV